MHSRTFQSLNSVYSVRVPGSCGELVQGTLQGQPFLVTSPIDQYVRWQFHRLVNEEQIKPQQILPKSLLALTKTLAYCQGPGVDEYLAYWQLERFNPLPIGKGMASSSADLAAVIMGAALTLGIALEPAVISQIAVSIEPTDGVFFPGIVQFDHVSGRQCLLLGGPPAITLAIFDGGGMVDTLQFNNRPDLEQLNQLKEKSVREALSWVKAGIKASRPDWVAQGATLSALANQAIVYQSALDEILRLGRETGALGLCTAHSGTVIGVMFSGKSEQEINSSVSHILRYCSEVQWLGQSRLVAGGFKIEKE